MTDTTDINIPGYRITRLLGQGGMASVYLAIQESCEREVALKVLSPSLVTDTSFTERFIREAKIVSRLVHPNIVTVYDAGVVNNHYYLSMEYVPGQDLKQARHQLTLEQRLQAVKDVARALDAAGEKGYVHRDVKPENIMLHSEDGRAVLMDFGIARPTEVSSGMTQTGTAIGTPHYMSPEQARGKAVDSRADLYSLGVVLYLLLVGEVPFDADSAVAIGIKHVSDPIPRLPSEFQLFQPLLNTCLSKHPEHRFQNGGEFIAALEQLDAGALAEIAELITARTEKITPPVDSQATTMMNVPVQEKDVDLTAISDSGHPENKTAVVIQPEFESHPTVIESGRTPVWSWLTAAGLAASVMAGVIYHQQLPEAERIAVAEKLVNELDAARQKISLQENLIPASAGLPSAQKADSAAPEPVTATVSEIASLEPGLADTQETLLKENRLQEIRVQGAEIQDVVPMDVVPMAELQHEASELEAGQSESLNDVLAELAEQQLGLDDVLSQAPDIANRYRQLLGRYPEQSEIREQLLSLRKQFEARLTVALEQRNFDMGQQLLDNARSSFPRLAQEPRFQRWQAQLLKAQQLHQHLVNAQQSLQQNRIHDALQAFKQAKALEPDNQQVTEGMANIVSHYVRAAQAGFEQGQWQSAQQAVINGLAIVPKHQQLQKLSKRIDAQRKLDELIQQARHYQQQDKLLGADNKNAFALYQQVLLKRPSHPVALRELAAIEKQQHDRSEISYRQGRLEQAKAEVRQALVYFPQSRQLKSLQQNIDNAIAEAFAATQPRVSKVLVSNTSLSSIVDKPQDALAVDRVIHVGFQFENFETDSSVVQAVLFDGARSFQIAQVPVIISGQDGVHFFRIERPVEGFGDGGYSMDLLLGDTRLTSTRFEVKNNSAF